ncbi:MAG: IS5 family transposase [Planctomycetota bacterium]|nr:IS5 family transposase [Planctomycetota bacterium]
MRGRVTHQPNLFVNIHLESMVPQNHPLRPIKRMADEALASMSKTFTACYSKTGRPSVPPERLVKAVMLMTLYTIRSERQLCERICFDMLFRWFLDMTPDEVVFDHSDFSKNRDRLDRLDATGKFSDKIIEMAYEAGLISEEHFSLDGSLIQSMASLKSVKRKEELRAAANERQNKDKNDKGSGQSDSNRWVDFKGEKRRNATHRSATDPQARLYTKNKGVAYLQHSMHVLMENRNGYAERRSGLRLIRRVRKRFRLRPRTLGVDKGYDCGKFLAALSELGVKPHAASKAKKPLATPDPEDSERWERWVNQNRQGDKGYQTSQRKRKLVEEVFGWLKTVGNMRRARVVGRWKIQQFADVALATLNMVRMSKLIGA